MTDAEIVLRALLSNGPRQSREVVAAMADRGFSAKQIRRAREHQRLHVRRTGSGRSMASIWELLPDVPNSKDAPSTPNVARVRARVHRGSVRPDAPMVTALALTAPGGSGVGGDGDPGRAPDTCELIALSGEQLPGMDDKLPPALTVRVERCVAQGVPQAAAVDLAARVWAAMQDSDMRARGTCLDCQNHERGECPVAVQPRDVVHECWYRRAV